MPPKNDLMLYKEHRLRTFHEPHTLSRKKISWDEINDAKYVDPLVESGFFFAPVKTNHARIQCSYCGKPETFSRETDISTIPTKHYLKNKSCLLSLVMLSGVVRDQYSTEPQNRDYWTGHESRVLRNPLDTRAIRFRRQFYGDKFPLDNLEIGPNSDSLCKAGFIYSPLHQDDDRVICIYCGCSLEGWEKEDDPLVEHETNTLGYCYFLEQIKGEHEAKEVEKEHERIIEEEHVEQNQVNDLSEDFKEDGIADIPNRNHTIEATKHNDYFGILSSDEESTGKAASDIQSIKSVSPSPPAIPEPLQVTESESEADTRKPRKSRKQRSLQAKNDPNDIYWNKLPDTELFDELMGTTQKSLESRIQPTEDETTKGPNEGTAKEDSHDLRSPIERIDPRKEDNHDTFDSKNGIEARIPPISKAGTSPQSSTEEQGFEVDADNETGSQRDIESGEESNKEVDSQQSTKRDFDEEDSDEEVFNGGSNEGSSDDEPVSDLVNSLESDYDEVVEEGSSFREDLESEESFISHKPVLRRSARTRSKSKSVSVEPRELSTSPKETRAMKRLSDSYESEDEFSFSTSKKRKTQKNEKKTEKEQGITPPIPLKENIQKMSEIYSPNRRKSRKLKVVINKSPQQNDLDTSNQLDDYGEDNVEFLEKQVIIKPVENLKKVEKPTEKAPELSPIKLGKTIPVDDKLRKRNIELFDLKPSKRKPNIFDMSFENDFFNMKATSSKRILENLPSPKLLETSMRKPQFEHTAEPIESDLPPDVSVSTDIELSQSKSATAEPSKVNKQPSNEITGGNDYEALKDPISEVPEKEAFKLPERDEDNPSDESDISESIYANYIKDIKDINDELLKSFDAESSEEEYLSLESDKEAIEEKDSSANGGLKMSELPRSISPDHVQSESEQPPYVKPDSNSSPVSDIDTDHGEKEQSDLKAKENFKSPNNSVSSPIQHTITEEAVSVAQEISDSLISVGENEKLTNIISVESKLVDGDKVAAFNASPGTSENISPPPEEEKYESVVYSPIKYQSSPELKDSTTTELKDSIDSFDVASPKSENLQRSEQSESELKEYEQSELSDYKSELKNRESEIYKSELKDSTLQDPSTSVRTTGKFSGNFSGLLEASTPNKAQQRNSWVSRPLEHLLETLTNMEETSNDLRELTKSANDLHDDYDSQLTNFISAMPENEENMTIREWIRHSASTSRNIVKEYSNEVIAFYDKEYKRALDILESLPTE